MSKFFAEDAESLFIPNDHSIWGNSGQSLSECSRDQQMRQGNGVETSLGEVKGVSSSRCFSFSIILTRSTGDGEGDGVAYAEIG